MQIIVGKRDGVTVRKIFAIRISLTIWVFGYSKKVERAPPFTGFGLEFKRSYSPLLSNSKSHVFELGSVAEENIVDADDLKGDDGDPPRQTRKGGVACPTTWSEQDSVSH